MVFTLMGRQYQVSKEEIEQVMVGVQPIRGKYCFAVVNGQKYPPIQILYYTLRRRCLGLSLSDFRNQTAKNILEQMGFELIADNGN